MSEALSSSGSLLDRFLDFGFDEEHLRHTTESNVTRQKSVERPQWVSPSYADLMLEVGGSLVPKIMFDQINIQGFLGRGFTWTVRGGIWNDHGNKRRVALKFLNVDVDTDDTQHSTWDKRTKAAFAAAESEIRILSHKIIRANQNIVTLLGISFQVHSIGSGNEPLALPILVEELAFLTPEGIPATLSEDIMSNPVALNPAMKLMFLLDIARGLLDLHQLNIVHADLKPSNILLFPHTSGRAVAKISDFGFCQSLDEEDPAQGSTLYWAAPECLPEADETMKPWRSSTHRDLFSFGLLIWFVLFEEGPFGDEESFDYATMAREKFEDSMKDMVDKQLLLSYRWHSQDPTLLEGGWWPKHGYKIIADGTQQEVDLELQSVSDHIANGSVEEQMRTPRKDWDSVKSFADDFAIVQVMFFFLSFFLVRQPQLRVGLRFFLEMTNHKLFHKIAMANFLGLSTCDHLWQTLFNPAKRQLFIDGNDSIFRKGNFLHVMTQLCMVRLKRDHDIVKLSEAHKVSMSTHFSKPILFKVKSFENAPACVPPKILESLIAKANSIPGNESGEVCLQVGDCYRSGFGTEKSVPDALEWLLRSAHAGESLAQGMVLSRFTLDQLPEDVKYVKLVEWLWQSVSVALSHPIDVIEDSRKQLRNTHLSPPNLERSLANIKDYLLEVADLSTFAALKVEFDGIFEYGQKFAWTQPEYEATLKINLALIAISSGGVNLWDQVDDAIRTEDLSSLRRLISHFPQLIAQEPRKGSILHYAVLLSRQIVARMLVLEHHMDPSHLDDLGLSAIALAICCQQDSTSNLDDFVTQARANLSDLNFPMLLLLSLYTQTGTTTASWIGTMASMLPVRQAIAAYKLTGVITSEPPFVQEKEAIGPSYVDAALVWAIWANNHRALFWLLDIGANVNKRFKDIHFLTPLHCASERMKPLLVLVLLIGGASPNTTASQGRTALHLACSTYQGPRAEYGTCSAHMTGDHPFPESGFCRIHDPPHFDPKWGLHVLGDDSTAEERTHCQSLVVQLLLYHGATIDARDSNGRTPLAYSIGTRAFHISEKLLTANPPANINIRNDFGLTPLGEACELFRCAERATFCLKWGADVDIKDELGRTPLLIAAEVGNLELCRLLIAAGANIAAVDVENHNCLVAALRAHQWECAEYLLSVVEGYQQDGVIDILESCDLEGLNCLGYCVYLQSEVPPDLADRFLSLYAATGIIDAANASGYTPLHLAVSFGYVNWVSSLLDHGADPAIPDTIYGWTPTMLGIYHPLMLSIEMLKLIMDMDKFTEEPEQLMGWRAGWLIFWVQSTLYLEGLSPEYYEIANRMRALTIPRAVNACQRESERRKAQFPRESFDELTTRQLERKGLLRWKMGTGALELPPFDIFTDPNNSYLLDAITVDEGDINDRSRRDTRIVPRAWKAYPDGQSGKAVWIYDEKGRFRTKTLVHLMPRRNWRVWVMNDVGEFQIQSP